MIARPKESDYRDSSGDVWRIDYNPKSGGLGHDWDGYAEDYDGPPDRRCTTGSSREDVIESIEEYVEDRDWDAVMGPDALHNAQGKSAESMEYSARVVGWCIAIASAAFFVYGVFALIGGA